MSRIALWAPLMLVMLASSYLTMGIVDPSAAGAHWAPYAVATFVLGVLIMWDRRCDDRRAGRRRG